MRNGRIYIGETEILDANINRSPTSYLKNPAEERAQYVSQKFPFDFQQGNSFPILFQFRYIHDTDKTMTQLRFVDNENNYMGVINWYAVHPTSMNNTNKLVTSDNVGFASILLEREMDPDAMPGQGKIVAAFASANLGDSSPNTAGPKCEFSGKACDLLSSSCPPDEGHCFASGPGKDQFDSCKMIATKLFDGARSILQRGPGREVTGEISYIHQFIDMSSAKTKYFNPMTKQYEMVSSIVTHSTTKSIDFNCHFARRSRAVCQQWAIVLRPAQRMVPVRSISRKAPSPTILFGTQFATFWRIQRRKIFNARHQNQFYWPLDALNSHIRGNRKWFRRNSCKSATLSLSHCQVIASLHTIQIHETAIAIRYYIVVLFPTGEFTTMSGRRVRNVVRDAALQAGVSDEAHVILAGLSNIYTSYVATPEEYVMQRYEAASTIFGPHTLTLYLNQFDKLMQAMARNETVEPGPSPPLLDDKVISLTPPVFYDSAPYNKHFGDVTLQPAHQYDPGTRVNVQFISGNPRNNLQHEKTYFTIEKQDANGNWTVVATDASWETS